MNGQSNGSPKGLLGKKMFSLIAVALMIASCLVVVAAVDDSKAETNNYDMAITIDATGETWKMNSPAPKDKVYFDEPTHTLTLDNFSGTFTSYNAIVIQSGKGNDITSPLTIKVIGNNSIACQHDFGSCIGDDGGNSIIVVGDDPINDTLTMTTSCATDNPSVSSISCASLSIQNVGLTSSYSKVNGIITGLSGLTGVKISNSYIDIELIDCQSADAIQSFYGTITIDNNSVVSINKNSSPKITQSFHGLYGYEVEIIDSDVTINSNTENNGDSYGMRIDSNIYPTIENSNVISSGQSGAICNFDGSPGSSSSVNFKDVTIFGSKTATDPKYDDEIAIGSEIGLKYKSIMTVTSGGNTLSFDKNGGQGRAPESVILSSGESFTIPVCKLTKDGYDFDGWVDSNGKVYHAGDKFVMGDSDVALKANWKTAGIGMSMTVLAIIMFFCILLIIGIVFAVRKDDQ